MKQTVLIIAHGSKVKSTDETMTQYIDALRAKQPELRIEKCYLQLMEPGLDAAIDALYQDGVRSLKAFPFFLFKGNHIREDIPAELDGIRAKYPDLDITFLDNIGFDDKLVDLIIERVK